MFQLLEKLRQIPDGQKKWIAFSVSFLCVGIIFVIWLSIIFPGILGQKQIADKVASMEPSPFSVFVKNISGGFASMGEQFGELKASVSSLITPNELLSATSTTPATTTTEEKLEIINASTTVQY